METTGWKQDQHLGYIKAIGHRNWLIEPHRAGGYKLKTGLKYHLTGIVWDTVARRATVEECQKLAHDTALLWDGAGTEAENLYPR